MHPERLTISLPTDNLLTDSEQDDATRGRSAYITSAVPNVPAQCPATPLIGTMLWMTAMLIFFLLASASCTKESGCADELGFDSDSDEEARPTSTSTQRPLRCPPQVI